MTLKEAIEINEDLSKGIFLPKIEAHRDALKLGIEALKFVKARRTIYGSMKIMILPGETL